MQERKRFELIKQISAIIREKLDDPSVISTVVDLTLPQKGGQMKVYLSIFPEVKEKEIIKLLNKNSFKIKQDMIKRVFLRYLPNKIIFYSSSVMKNADQVLRLIDEINKEENSTSETGAKN